MSQTTNCENHRLLKLLQKHKDIKSELKKLCTALLQHYLNILDIMVHDPPAARYKIRELEIILENIYYLLNKCRPQQARAILLLIMKLKNEERTKAMEGLQK